MITIFTGAGASRSLEYPTTSEFFTSGTGADLMGDPVYKQTARHLQKQQLDVEDVLRLLYPFADLYSTPTGKFIFPHIRNRWIEQIPEFVAKTNKACFDHYGRLPQEQDVKRLYLPALDRCGWKQERVTLFTTNYDPVTDVLMEIAESSGIPSHDGFNRFGTWDSGGYSRLKAGGLAIYRLHGSMSWVESDGRIRNTRDYSQRAPGYAEHLIIYPGFKGNPEQEGHSAYRFAHTALRKELGETSAVLTIGFSFRDPHLNDIFREALTTNQRLTLIVWNPIWPEGSDVGLAELKQEFESRIKHLSALFGADDALGQLDDLLK
jgi:hypothetical protein